MYVLQAARAVLTEIGRTLAQLGITVENAVNAGLLGGLSAADIRVSTAAQILTFIRKRALGIIE